MITHSAASPHYLEDRHAHQHGAVADMMRHFERRYENSTALVLTEHPDRALRFADKQWTRQAAALQQKRSASTNANDILELTVTITHMQRAAIVPGLPSVQPHAAMWISDQLPIDLPATCHSVYLLDIPANQRRGLKEFVVAAPSQTLFVDYTGVIAPKLANWPLRLKSELEAEVIAAWHELETYLKNRQLSVKPLLPDNPAHYENFDNALDTLLDNSAPFLLHAARFEEALQRAEPFPYATSRQREAYAIMALLTKRVHALTPSILNRYLNNLEDSEGFYLQDGARAQSPNSLGRAIARHYAAGRQRLARALELYVFARL